MFKFFPNEEEANNDESSSASQKLIELREAKEVDVRQVHYDIAREVPTILVKKPESITGKLKYVKVSDLVDSSFVRDQQKVKDILGSTSDLVSGEYEGGFKVWECTFDLLQYLERLGEDNPIKPGINVLDLGCGSGLLGLYAVMKQANVVFQDYNAEVIDFLTVPNTIANFGDEGLSRCRYFSGDWSSFLGLIRKRREIGGEKELQFEVILTSETIYNTLYLESLVDLLLNCLKPDGVIYVAAKTCYFGVGGGTRAFKTLLSKHEGLVVDTVVVIKEGIHREILQIRSTSDKRTS